MEILVLIMLALFLIIIAIAVIIYVIVRKNVVENKFNNIDDSDFDDEEDDEDFNMNIVMPTNFQNIDNTNNINLNVNDDFFNKKEKDDKEEIDVTKDNDSFDKSVVSLGEKSYNEIKDNSSDDNVLPIIDNIPIKEEKSVKYDYVINVLINKKNYIFLANGNNVDKNERIKILLDGKIYYGLVTKSNYQRDISMLKIKPRKLNIVKRLNKFENNCITTDDMDFVPIKKNSI